MPALSKKSPRIAWVLNISEGRSSQGRETKRPPIQCKRQVTSAPPALRLAFPAASQNCPALRRKDCAAASAGEHCTGDRRPILQRTNQLPWGFPSTCSTEASLFERPEEHEFHIWICSGTFEGLANERSARRPQRELGGKQKQRGPRRLVKSEHASGSDQPREGMHNSRSIGEKLQNATAHYSIEGRTTCHLIHVRLRRY